MNDGFVEVIAGQMAEAAHCEPHMKAIPFPRGNNANSVYWPTCVNVQRCGGCCGSDILSCVPTSVKMVTFYVSRHMPAPVVVVVDVVVVDDDMMTLR